MAYDHEAIYKAYSDCVRIDDVSGAYKADGTKITLIQSDIDAARTTLDSEAAAVKYKTDRKGGTGIEKTGTYYAEIEDQLDMLYKDIVAGKLDTTGTWATHIKLVKDTNPKPS